MSQFVALNQIDTYFSYLLTAYFGGCLSSYFAKSKKYEVLSFLTGGTAAISIAHLSNTIQGYNQKYVKVTFLNQVRIHIIATFAGLVFDSLDTVLKTEYFSKTRIYTFTNTSSFYLFTHLTNLVITVLKHN